MKHCGTGTELGVAACKASTLTSWTLINLIFESVHEKLNFKSSKGKKSMITMKEFISNDGFPIFVYWFVFYFGVKTSDTQELFLYLCSESLLTGLRTIWDVIDQI